MQLHHYFFNQAKKTCVFCNPNNELIIHESEHFLLMLDPFALIPGHLLLTSKEHFGCLGDIPEELYAECDMLRQKGYELLSSHFKSGITRYEHGRAGHCMLSELKERSCHHYHEHLIPAELSLHKLLEPLFKSISFCKESEVIDLYYRYHEYLLVAESNVNKRLYIVKSEEIPPHFLRTVSAKALGVPLLHDWESYDSCENMLIGKAILLKSEDTVMI